MNDELNNLTSNFVEVQREAIRRTNEAIDVVNSKLGIRLRYPQVRFSIKGGVAGRAHCGADLIEYNPTLLGQNVKDFLRQTVRHEVAHLAAYKKFGSGIKAHGKEWCSCCWYLEIPAIRCHSYDIGRVPTRSTSSAHGSPIRRTESGIVIHSGITKVTKFED